MLKEADVNTTADGVDKLGTSMVNLLHLPHGRNCKPLHTKLRSIKSYAGGYSLMLCSQGLCHNQFFLYLSKRQSTSQRVGHSA